MYLLILWPAELAGEVTWVRLCLSLPSVLHTSFHSHLNLATFETDPDDVHIDPLWFALSVPSVFMTNLMFFYVSLTSDMSGIHCKYLHLLALR